jgi:LysR family glycine cleavage system transcriptional activator
MDRLPPLNAIRAFEAAARHLSITVAGNELNVTPGAISRQIRLLEETLDIQLLHRGHRQIALAGPGNDYYRAVTKAMNALRDATRRLMKRAKRRQLKVRAYTIFAMRWLIPRLSSFHTANPGIEVLLTASLDPVDFRKEDIDGAIRLGDGKWSGVNAHRLVSNVLVPVCSPGLLSTGAKVRNPEDLKMQTLLHSIARPDDWGYWVKAAEVEKQVDARGGMTYQSSAMA